MRRTTMLRQSWLLSISVLAPRQGSCLAAGLLASQRDSSASRRLHQTGIVHDGDEAEAHADRARCIGGTAGVNARVDLALVAFLEDLVVDLQDLRLIAVEPW